MNMVKIMENFFDESKYMYETPQGCFSMCGKDCCYDSCSGGCKDTCRSGCVYYCIGYDYTIPPPNERE